MEIKVITKSNVGSKPSYNSLGDGLNLSTGLIENIIFPHRTQTSNKFYGKITFGHDFKRVLSINKLV